MSFDSYFCVCCLSTNDLKDLFGNIDGKSFVGMLKNNFAIQISQEEFYEESYICNSCCNKLIDTNTFKMCILQTIHTMEVNGLVKLENNKDYTVLKRIEDFDFSIEDEDKEKFQTHESQEFGLDNTIENIKTLSNGIKEENIDEKFFELLQETENLIQTELPIDTTQNNTSHSVDGHNTKNENNYDNIVSTLKGLSYEISVELQNKSLNEQDSPHICDQCGKEFSSLKCLKRHTISHKTGIFKCSFCEKEFKNYNAMQSHRSRKHGDKTLYKCTKCKERFDTFHRKIVHLAKIHGQTERKHKCTLCSSDFMTAGNLSSHMKSKHLKLQRYICGECDKGFLQKQDLRTHMYIHTGIKEFQCKTCLKKFLRKKSLVVHLRIHSNERNFACNQCSKKFIQKCTLQKHLQVHLKEFTKIKE